MGAAQSTPSLPSSLIATTPSHCASLAPVGATKVFAYTCANCHQISLTEHAYYNRDTCYFNCIRCGKEIPSDGAGFLTYERYRVCWACDEACSLNVDFLCCSMCGYRWDGSEVLVWGRMMEDDWGEDELEVEVDMDALKMRWEMVNRKVRAEKEGVRECVVVL